MFATMRQRFFWRNMYKDVEDMVRQCTLCAKNRVQERERVSMMKLFPANEPLEFDAIDILGPLPKTVHGNRFLLVISDRFSKLTRTIPMRTTTALAVSKAFCTHFGFDYDPPKVLLSDNGTQFTAKFFIEVVLYPLGFCLWPSEVSSERQWYTVYGEVLHRRVSRVRNCKSVYHCVQPSDQWSS
jgi:Integrase zinc binding domain